MWDTMQKCQISCCIIPSIKVIFYCWHLFARTSSCVCFIQIGFAHPPIHLPKIPMYTNMGDICNLNCHLVLASMLINPFSHTKGLGSWWIETMEFAPCFELHRKWSYNNRCPLKHGCIFGPNSNYLYKMHHGCGGCNIGTLVKFAKKTHGIPSHVYKP